MEFSRIGEHTIKCVISEEEIYDLGYTMDEIMSNGERTQEFMNQIFDMASEEFGTDFNSGIKTVRADFLADHTLSLTFSEHPATEGMDCLIRCRPRLQRMRKIKKAGQLQKSRIWCLL